MEVIRDTLWENCLSNAVTMYRLSEPDDRCYHLGGCHLEDEDAILETSTEKGYTEDNSFRKDPLSL